MTQVFREAVSIEQLNALSRNTAIESLGIVFSAAGDDWLQATMPVDERTRQPYGILHGGASVVLAETLGSSAGNLCVDTGKQICVGLEINANHVRAVRSGTVTGTARALHVGRSTQLWEIRIEDEQGPGVHLAADPGGGGGRPRLSPGGGDGSGTQRSPPIAPVDGGYGLNRLAAMTALRYRARMTSPTPAPVAAWRVCAVTCTAYRCCWSTSSCSCRSS
jgi:uncharacterized protein (TIGR00369 family)